MLKRLLGYTFAIGLAMAGAAYAAQLPLFTGPSGSNPGISGPNVPDANVIAQAINSNVAAYYSVSLTPAASSAAIQTAEQTFTVTGLLTTDTVTINGPAPTSLCPPTTARVSAANTLAIGFTTLTAAACTPAAGTYKIVAFH